MHWQELFKVGSISSNDNKDVCCCVEYLESDIIHLQDMDLVFNESMTFCTVQLFHYKK